MHKMDLLVTTPKSEIRTSKKEGEIVEQEGGYWFRTFRFKPKVNVGDKIYFVEDGLIRGRGVIIDISQTDGELCEVTGRVWGNPGDWVVKYSNWTWLITPIPFKGFQGIRYIDNIPHFRQKLQDGR